MLDVGCWHGLMAFLCQKVREECRIDSGSRLLILQTSISWKSQPTENNSLLLVGVIWGEKHSRLTAVKFLHLEILMTKKDLQ